MFYEFIQCVCVSVENTALKQLSFNKQHRNSCFHSLLQYLKKWSMAQEMHTESIIIDCEHVQLEAKKEHTDIKTAVNLSMAEQVTC